MAKYNNEVHAHHETVAKSNAVLSTEEANMENMKGKFY